MLIDDDPSLLHAALGEAVTHTASQGGVVTHGLYGIFNRPGQTAFGAVMVSEPSLRFVVANFPAVARLDLLQIDGVTWRVRQAPELLNDGVEAQCLLESAS